MGVFAVAFLVRAASVGEALTFDEFYHILAAQSLLADGDLVIAEGMSPYLRARAFTYMVAGSMQLFGESLIAARLPSLLFGSLWVTLLFVWVRPLGGVAAALVAAGLLCLDPHAIGMSQIARMYAMHGFVLWLGIAIVFQLVTNGHGPRSRLLMVAGALLAFGLAYHLQATTVIGVAALAAWPIMRILARRLSEDRRNWRRLGVAIVIGLLLGVALSLAGVGSQLVRRFVSANARQTLMDLDPRYYYWWLASSYPLLLGFAPVALLLAIRRNRSLALYCASILIIALSLHSAAAAKQVRYAHYTLPALFVVWGLAAAEILPRIVALANDAANYVRRAVPAVTMSVARGFILAVCAVFMAAASPSVPEALRLSLPTLERHSYGTNVWPEAVERLEPFLDEETIVVSTAIPQTLYFLKRGDIEVGANFLPGNAPEFTPDWRFGIPVLTTREALESVVRCHSRGLLIVHGNYWRASWGITPEMAEYVLSTMTEVEMEDVGGRLRAFQWTHSETAETPNAGCGVFSRSRGAVVEVS